MDKATNPVVATTLFFAETWAIREYANGVYDAAEVKGPGVSPGLDSFDEAVQYVCEQEAARRVVAQINPEHVERQRVFSSNRTRTVYASSLRPGAVVMVEAVEGFLFGIVIKVEPRTSVPGTIVTYGYGNGDGARTTRQYPTGGEVQLVGAR